VEHETNEFKGGRVHRNAVPGQATRQSSVAPSSARRKAIKRQVFYAVRKGRQTGIFQSWEMAKKHVEGFGGAQYKKFATAHDAAMYLNVPTPATNQAIPVVGTPTRGASGIATARSGMSRPRLATTASQDDQEEDEDEREEPRAQNRVVVNTDGACRYNGRPNAISGIGVFWGKGDGRNVRQLGPTPHTNNRAELMAILMALQIYDRDLSLQEAGPLVVRTDSEYGINSLQTWLAQRIENNWKTKSGAAVQNLDLLFPIVDLLRQHPETRLEFVKGHSGDYGNETADALANEAIDAHLKRIALKRMNSQQDDDDDS